ncbi:MAG: ABC transporter substrate-binding protein [Candidatus Dormibacter sp.]
MIAACGTTTTPTSSTPTSGGTLIVTYKDEPKTLDPAIGYDTTSWPEERAIFNGLLDYKPSSTELAPDMAEAMPTITNGGKTYTFKIRAGVKFSNGREVTADDYKYSWERMLDPTTQGPMTGGPFFGGITGAQDFFAGTATHISGIKVVDAHTLEVDLDTPNQSFLNIVAMPFAFVVPKEAVAAAGADWPHKPVGAGQYTLDKWTAGQTLVLKRNPTYFGKAAYLNEVDFQIGVTDELGVIRLQNGQADLVDPGISLPAAQFIQLSGNATFKNRIVRQPNVDLWYLSMNVNMPPFDNKLVRQAFNYVVNKANQVKVLNGRGIINNGLQAPPMPGYVPNYNPLGLDKNGQNIAKARALLAQAGYGGGHPFPAQDMVYAKANTDSDNLAAAIQQDFQQVGITINLKGLSFPAYLDLVGKPNTTPLSYNSWYQDFPDPSDFIDPLLTCGAANVQANGSNAAFYCNKQVDVLADQARGDTNTAERLKLYQQIQDIIVTKDFPQVPLFSTIATGVSATRVRGFSIHPVWGFDLAPIWVSGGK